MRVWSLWLAALLSALLLAAYFTADAYGAIPISTYDSFILLVSAIGLMLVVAIIDVAIRARKAAEAREAAGPESVDSIACSKCGYSLIGIPGGVCPECATNVPDPACWHCGYSLRGLDTEQCPERGSKIVVGTFIRDLSEGFLGTSGQLRCSICKQTLADPAVRRCPSCGGKFREPIPSSKT